MNILTTSPGPLSCLLARLLAVVSTHSHPWLLWAGIEWWHTSLLRVLLVLLVSEKKIYRGPYASGMEQQQIGHQRAGQTLEDVFAARWHCDHYSKQA